MRRHLPLCNSWTFSKSYNARTFYILLYAVGSLGSLLISVGLERKTRQKDKERRPSNAVFTRNTADSFWLPFHLLLLDFARSSFFWLQRQPNSCQTVLCSHCEHFAVLFSHMCDRRLTTAPHFLWIFCVKERHKPASIHRRATPSSIHLLNRK